MAYESKMDAELELALKFYQTSVGTIFSENTGISLTGEWELIVKYHDDILTPVQTVGAKVEILNEEFASIVIAPPKIEEFASFFEIEYMQLPQRMFYILQESYGKACLSNVHKQTPYNLLGKGVMLGMIDSGINYLHPDFRNDDGTTRILYLWDQTITGEPPLGFSLGTEYTQAQIDEALMAPTVVETIALVPSVDEVGHGTAVAGVAGGNGLLSGGREVGVAPEADFIIVKVGTEKENSFPRTLEVMRAIKYVIDKAIEIDRPIAINIGFGMVQGGHDGRTLLEIFIDQMAIRWKCNIIVGVGNQGNQANHTRGVLETDEEQEIQFVITPDQRYYGFNLWKSFIDTFDIKIKAPTGEETDRISSTINNVLYEVGRTNIFVNFSEPSAINADEQISVFMEAQDGDIDFGIWTIILYGENIIDGSYNIWGATKDSTGYETIFLQPTSSETLTIPSTSVSTISVGAFSPYTNQIIASSGRGFTRDNRVKPGLAAPGMDIITANNEGGYSPATGTSIASAFVTGGAALLMEWGIVKENDPSLYGDRLRIALIRNTKRLAKDFVYPNQMWGYGAFCLEDTLISLINK